MYALKSYEDTTKKLEAFFKAEQAQHSVDTTQLQQWKNILATLMIPCRVETMIVEMLLYFSSLSNIYENKVPNKQRQVDEEVQKIREQKDPNLFVNEIKKIINQKVNLLNNMSSDWCEYIKKHSSGINPNQQVFCSIINNDLLPKLNKFLEIIKTKLDNLDSAENIEPIALQSDSLNIIPKAIHDGLTPILNSISDIFLDVDLCCWFQEEASQEARIFFREMHSLYLSNMLATTAHILSLVKSIPGELLIENPIDKALLIDDPLSYCDTKLSLDTRWSKLLEDFKNITTKKEELYKNIKAYLSGQ